MKRKSISQSLFCILIFLNLVFRALEIQQKTEYDIVIYSDGFTVINTLHKIP